MSGGRSTPRGPRADSPRRYEGEPRYSATGRSSPCRGLAGDPDVSTIPALLAERRHPLDTVELIMRENGLAVFRKLLET
jgi:hypothetical protein